MSDNSWEDGRDDRNSNYKRADKSSQDSKSGGFNKSNDSEKRQRTRKYLGSNGVEPVQRTFNKDADSSGAKRSEGYVKRPYLGNKDDGRSSGGSNYEYRKKYDNNSSSGNDSNRSYGNRPTGRDENSYKPTTGFENRIGPRSERGGDKPYTTYDKSGSDRNSEGRTPYNSERKPYNNERSSISDRPYNSDRPSRPYNERSPRTEGEGYKPRTEGYKPRGEGEGYKPRTEGYKPRGEGEGYRPRTEGYKPRGEGEGYRPRTEGYKPRTEGEGYKPRTEGYKPRGEGEGYKPRTEGYKPRGEGEGYRPRTEGYKPRGEGEGYKPRTEGYKPRGEGDSRYNRDSKASYGKDAKLFKGRAQREEPGIKPAAKLNAPEPDTWPIRLNRYISNAGICSRRKADELIEAGEITVNGEAVSILGTRVNEGDVVLYKGKELARERPVYILLNKPKDFITTTEDPEDRRTVMNLIGDAAKERVYPVGRLDRNTTGLLLFTNDGDLALRLTHPSNEIRKIYKVSLDKKISTEDFKKIAEGVELEDGKITVDNIAYSNPDDPKEMGVELHSGKNRIVRRIFEHLGYNVERLDRVYYAGLTKKDLPRGTWRYLTQAEVNMIKFKNI